jgi:plastocyanin
MSRGRLIALITALTLAAASTGALASASPSDSVNDNFYRPSKITIRRGTTVVWTWRGAVQHSVTDTKHRFGSRVMTQGSYRHKFRRAGTYTLYCTRHPETMRMKVIVK